MIQPTGAPEPSGYYQNEPAHGHVITQAPLLEEKDPLEQSSLDTSLYTQSFVNLNPEEESYWTSSMLGETYPLDDQPLDTFVSNENKLCRIAERISSTLLSLINEKGIFEENDDATNLKKLASCLDRFPKSVSNCTVRKAEYIHRAIKKTIPYLRELGNQLADSLNSTERSSFYHQNRSLQEIPLGRLRRSSKAKFSYNDCDFLLEYSGNWKSSFTGEMIWIKGEKTDWSDELEQIEFEMCQAAAEISNTFKGLIDEETKVLQNRYLGDLNKLINISDGCIDSLSQDTIENLERIYTAVEATRLYLADIHAQMGSRFGKIRGTLWTYRPPLHDTSTGG